MQDVQQLATGHITPTSVGPSWEGQSVTNVSKFMSRRSQIDWSTLPTKELFSNNNDSIDFMPLNSAGNSPVSLLLSNLISFKEANCPNDAGI